MLFTHVRKEQENGYGEGNNRIEGSLGSGEYPPGAADHHKIEPLYGQRHRPLDEQPRGCQEPRDCHRSDLRPSYVSAPTTKIVQ